MLLSEIQNIPVCCRRRSFGEGNRIYVKFHMKIFRIHVTMFSVDSLRTRRETMRPRNKKHLEERFEKCRPLVAGDPASLKGRWRALFGREGGRLHLEIGCGKGAFITGMAAAHPDTDFIAMECVKNVIVTALEKTEQRGLPNIRFVNENANGLLDFFLPGEIDCIYLNFSDPWPRKKQAKHRLTHPAFLKMYQTILAPGGRIIQKTDNRELFAFSIESFTGSGWKLSNVTYDLHAPETPSEILGQNIITEYERRFLEEGQPIHRLEAVPPDLSRLA